MTKARELSQLADITSVSSTELVFNETGADFDFRVESDTKTHALFVDASANAVGINTSTPVYDLDVNGAFRSTYLVPTHHSTTGSGNTGDNWWKLGYVNNLAGSRSMRITMLGTNSYSAGGVVSGETTILFRGNNATTTVEGTFWSDTEGNSQISAIGWKNIGADSFEIYVKFTNGYAGLDFFVETAAQWYNDVADTGSPSTPSGVTVEASKRVMYTGGVQNLSLTTSSTVVNDASADHDFRVESNNQTHALFVDAGNDVVEVNATFSMTPYTGYNASSNRNINIGASNYTAVDTGRFSKYRINVSGNAGGQDFNILGEKRTSTSSSSEYSLFRLDGYLGAAVFNEDSLDADFRIESDANSNAFLVNAGTSEVFMGTGTQFDAGARLHVAVAGSVGIEIGNATNFYGLWFAYNTVQKGYTQTTSTGTTYNTTSDRRLKHNIANIEDGVAKLKQMRPVEFDWIGDADAPRTIGFIAQEMQEVVPEAVSGEPDGEIMMGMDYGRITPILTAALQEALAKIETLEARIAALEAK